MNEPDISEQIQTAAASRILFLPHTIRQMARPDRMISSDEIRNAIVTGEIIEDYPEDARGHSCLILGFGQSNRPIHVVCTPQDEYLAIITAYLPDSGRWSSDFRRRL